MKRDLIKRYYHLSKIYPIFFWKECSSCNKEFRREWGWKVKVEMNKIYLCKTCAETENEVYNFVQKSLRPQLPKSTVPNISLIPPPPPRSWSYEDLRQ